MASPWQAGQIVAGGRYRLVRQIGRGSFGDVFLVEQLDEGGVVLQEAVIKVLHPQWAKVPQVVERFRRESQIGQRVEHPHVARIFEHGELEGGAPFIAMDYLPGRTLRAELLLGPLPPARALPLLASVGEALAAAHRAGVVHRDLKPENIILIERDGRPDFPVVLDFGVAKFLDAAERLTMTGAVLGTPAYMAPEQFRGDADLGPPADVYALGVLVFEACAGQPPFPNRSFAELAIAHTTNPAPPLPAAPREVARIVARCLEKDPKRRPRAEAVAQVLRAAAPAGPTLPASALPTVRMDEAAAATVLSDVARRGRAPRGRQLARALVGTAGALLALALGLLAHFLLAP